MSCFFCSSNNHVTHNCDIYKSNKERKKIVCQKKCCVNCLTNAFKEPINYLSCNHCCYKRKCFICFSKDHHTVFCPDRLTALNTFLPNIDRDLFPRFFQVLTLEEKYFLCLCVPVCFKSRNLTPFKVKYSREIFSRDIKTASNCDYIVAEIARIDSREYGCCYRTSVLPQGSIGLSKLKHITFRIRNLQIYKTKFLTAEFLQLLSQKIKILKCGKVEFLQELAFQEILLKAPPYMEEIDIHQTNVRVENSWPNDLFQFNQAEKLKDIHLKIGTGFNFDIESLAALMKKKNANISLSIFLPEDTDFDKTIAKKLSTHFVPNNSSFSSLTINNVDKIFNVIDSMKYELTDV